MEDKDGEREKEGGSGDLKGSGDGYKNSWIGATVDWRIEGGVGGGRRVDRHIYCVQLEAWGGQDVCCTITSEKLSQNKTSNKTQPLAAMLEIMSFRATR